MTTPLNPVLFSHLSSMQRSTHVGFHRTMREVRCSSRTVYRWQRSLGDQFLVVPNVDVEALGLRHAHVFVGGATVASVLCSLAVEAAVVTTDFCNEVTYLHCLVPAAATDRFLKEVMALGAAAQVVWSSSGWQQFLVDDAPIQLPVATAEGPPTELLHRTPFVIPALMELWQYPNSLPLAWQRIRHRLAGQLKAYLPRTKIRYINGMTHLTEAFTALRREGLVRQQLIRYHPLLAVSVEVFLCITIDREALVPVLEGLRPSLHAVETYPTKKGYWCRLLGPHRLLDAIINLPMPVREACSSIHFHTKRHPTPHVRFHYETYFTPTTGMWTVNA